LKFILFKNKPVVTGKSHFFNLAEIRNRLEITQLSLNKTIKSDLYRHEGLKGFRGFLKGLFIPGFRYTFFFRLTTKYSKRSLIGIMARFFKRRYRFRYGYEIDPDAIIGYGFFLTGHCGPVVIGPIRIGKNCNIGHSVTIGRSYKGGKLGRPAIGDFVWIGPGAVIVGPVKVGNNVLIAPNSFVNFDVPDNTLVIGNPGKMFSKENPTRNYINDIIDEKLIKIL
jgi:serine O-acetyltransferase